MNSSDLGRGGMCVICCQLPVLICFQHRKFYRQNSIFCIFSTEIPKVERKCERKTYPVPNIRNLFEYFSSWWRTLTKSMVKFGLYNRRCGRDAANEQIVGYAINWLQRYNTLFFVDKQAWRVRWRKRRKNPRPAVKVRFFFVIVEGALLILWNFVLENVNLRIKGTRRLILPFMFVVNVIL